jgi:hypothetical protein
VGALIRSLGDNHLFALVFLENIPEKKYYIIVFLNPKINLI